MSTGKILSQICSNIVQQIKESREVDLSTPGTISDHLKPVIISVPEKSSFHELEVAKAARRRTFVHYPHSTPSGELLAENGWSYCNVDDRVLCLYCDTICHQWTSLDDPGEVHARLSPDCIFVRSMIANKKSSSQTKASVTHKSIQPKHPSMRELTRREATFETMNWKEPAPTVESLVRAGFFYLGVGNTVACFFCGGSLQKWAPKDNPLVEHARWFPHCTYAKDLCGERLHARIHLKHVQLTKGNTPNKEMLERLVNARLDLPIVEQLRSKYAFSVIRKCIETQLKMGEDDFSSNNDFQMACYILQKQIDIIQGHPERVLVPSHSDVAKATTTARTEGTPRTKFEECVICLSEERQVACIPCGHLCSCVVCGYAIQACPMCRKPIESLVRIY